MLLSRLLAPLALALALSACSPAPLAIAGEPGVLAPAPAIDMPRTSATSETAVLAGGCFWGLEGVFEHVRGVTRVRSGYAGGDLTRANYDAVSSGTTGNAESVEIVYDPRVISYGRILQIYFSVATDPTQLNRQGPDTGTQYRGNIFFADAQQEHVARAYIAQLTTAHTFHAPIVTRVDRLVRFVPAEAYHQNYLSLNPTQPYIVRNDLPKIAELRRLFPERYTSERAA